MPEFEVSMYSSFQNPAPVDLDLRPTTLLFQEMVVKLSDEYIANRLIPNGPALTLEFEKSPGAAACDFANWILQKQGVQNPSFVEDIKSRLHHTHLNKEILNRARSGLQAVQYVREAIPIYRMLGEPYLEAYMVGNELDRSNIVAEAGRMSLKFQKECVQ